MPETLSGQRAQNKVLQMQAHANAIDTLMENGTIVTPGEDPLEAPMIPGEATSFISRFVEYRIMQFDSD